MRQGYGATFLLGAIDVEMRARKTRNGRRRVARAHKWNQRYGGVGYFFRVRPSSGSKVWVGSFVVVDEKGRAP